jgi:hypothetical protein
VLKEVGVAADLLVLKDVEVVVVEILVIFVVDVEIVVDLVVDFVVEDALVLVHA